MNCPAVYANSIDGFEGPQSFDPENMPLDPHADYSLVHNAALVSVKVEAFNVEKDGFPNSQLFLDWITNGPIAIKLNRPCRSGEEIVVDYPLFTKDFEIDPSSTPTISPAKTRQSPRLQAKVTGTPISAKAVVNLEIDSPVSGSEEKISGTPSGEFAILEDFSKEEADREENCAECTNKVKGLHKCDVCKRKMHGFCGVGIGEERSTQVRRCKVQPCKKTASDSVSKSNKRKPAVSLFQPPPSEKEQTGAPAPAKNIGTETSAESKTEVQPTGVPVEKWNATLGNAKKKREGQKKVKRGAMRGNPNKKRKGSKKPPYNNYGSFATSSKSVQRSIEEIEQYTEMVASAQVRDQREFSRPSEESSSDDDIFS